MSLEQDITEIQKDIFKPATPKEVAQRQKDAPFSIENWSEKYNSAANMYGTPKLEKQIEELDAQHAKFMVLDFDLAEEGADEKVAQEIGDFKAKGYILLHYEDNISAGEAIMYKLEGAKIPESINEEDEEEETDDPSALFVPVTDQERGDRKLQAAKKELEDKLKKVKIIKRSDGSVNIEGNLDLEYLHNLTSLKQLGLNIYMIKGNFGCESCNLTDLYGSPRIVTGNFDCNNNRLKTLIGGPIRVYGHYNCRSNDLTTLEHGPKFVGGDFNCSRNENLTNLSGIKDIDIHGIVRAGKNTNFGFDKTDFLKFKLRKGVQLESKVNEDFRSDIITFLRRSVEDNMRWLAPIAWDQVTSEDVTVLNAPDQVVRDYKAGKYPDSILFFIILKLDSEKMDKMYAREHGERFHLPHILYVLGASNDEDPMDTTHPSRTFKGTTISMAKLADIVIAVPKSKFSTDTLTKARHEAKSGTNMSNDDIKDANIERYRKILAAKRADVNFATIAKELLDYVTALSFETRTSEKGSEILGEYEVIRHYRYEKARGKTFYLDEFLKQIWEEIDSGMGYLRRSEDEEADEDETEEEKKESESYNQKKLSLIKSSMITALKAIKDKRIDLTILEN